MSTPKQRLNYITTAAFIAAVYAGLTYLGNFFGLSYVPIGPIQIRFSEALTILPLFTPAAIPGLTIGCFLANIASFNLWDMLFGTFATFLAAVLTYSTRKIIFKKLPLLPLLFPVIVNAIIIGLELSYFLPQGFWIAMLSVGIGQLIACYGLGLPLYFTLKGKKFSKLNIFKAEE